MPNRPIVGILGASGFIGNRLVEWLILSDLAMPRPIVRSFKGMARAARFDLDCRLADATDQVALEAQLRGCEVVFHCVVGGRETILRSVEAAYLAAASAGVRRLVYLSSAVVHGNNPAPGTHDDSKLIARQQFEYNVSKVKAEHLLRRLSADGAVEVVTLRPLIVYGPRSKWWTAQIASDLLSGKAYLIDGGTGVCNAVYVDNLVRAMWQAAIAQKAGTQAFIITDGEPVTWRDLYGAVAEVVGVNMANVPCIESAELARMYREQKHAQMKFAFGRFTLAMRNNLPTGVINIVRKILPSGAIKVISRQLETPPATTFPIIDPEIASLQQCRYLLPISKAQELLGYVPQVTFSEACRRTGEWLSFVSETGANRI